MSKKKILSHITIEKLIFGGKGLATAPDGRRIIVSGGVVPGSVVNLRILKSKKSHIEAQQLDVVKRSPIEKDLLPGHQLYGGAKWLTIGYEDQLQIKEQQVREALHHLHLDFHSLGEEISPLPSEVGESQKPTFFHHIIPSPEIYGYRNKVEFSWGKYISEKEGIHDDFRFGFHVNGQFDRIENCVFCALADEEMNAIFHDVDRLSRASGLPTYDQKTGVGFWRHFVIRKGKKTGEILLIFSVNGIWDISSYPEKSGKNHRGEDSRQSRYSGIGSFSGEEFRPVFAQMVRELTEKYPHIRSISLLENTGKADIVTGNSVGIFGHEALREELLGYRFDIQPKSFFQVNTLAAEKLYEQVRIFCARKSDESRTYAFSALENSSQIGERPTLLFDLYAGTGTIGILLSDIFSEVYSVELVSSASSDGEKNAQQNGIKNIHFINGKVEDFVREWHEGKYAHSSSIASERNALTLVIDPPREGIHPSAFSSLLSFGAECIVYVSCNPATLARDLEILTGIQKTESLRDMPQYRITDIVPVDMFPHTHHIETVVRMQRLYGTDGEK